MSLWRLEWLRLTRTGRLPALGGVFAFFGLVGPLTARYLPQIIDRFGGEIEVIVPDPIPVDGIAQFSANAIQIGLLVAIVVAAGALTVDAVPEMSVFLRTRVRSAARLLAPRVVVVTAAVAIAYLLGVALAWYETAVLLGSVPAGGLLLGALLGVLYLGFAMAVVAAAGSRASGVLGTVLVALVVLLALPMIGLAEPIGRWLPSHLVGAQTALVSAGSAGDYLGSTLVTLATTAGLLAAAIRSVGAREI